MSALDMLLTAGAAIGTEERLSIPWARIVLAFLFSVGLAFAAIAYLRRRHGHRAALGEWWKMALRGTGEGRQLELVERLTIGPASYLVLVRFGERRLLIISSPAGAHLLRELPPEAEG